MSTWQINVRSRMRRDRGGSFTDYLLESLKHFDDQSLELVHIDGS